MGLIMVHEKYCLLITFHGKKIIMITPLEEYETQRKLLKVRFYPCYLPTNMKQAPSEKLAKPVSIVITRQFLLH